MKLSAYDVAVLAVILALMVLTSFLPFVFFVPVLVMVCLRGFKLSLITGLLFGVLSLGLSYMGSSPVAYAFIQAPWIPIVTRVLAVAGARAFRLGLDRLPDRGKKRTRLLRASLTAGMGSLLNTGLVFGAILLFASVAPGMGANGEDVVMKVVMPAIIALNAPIELVLNMLLVPPIVLAVQNVEQRFPKRRGGRVTPTLTE